MPVEIDFSALVNDLLKKAIELSAHAGVYANLT